MTEAKKQSYEDAVENLKSIVQKLEHGDVPLDSALSEFERGMKLIKTCDKMLTDAEKKFETLMKKKAVQNDSTSVS